jgi:hypothetical protein
MNKNDVIVAAALACAAAGLEVLARTIEQKRLDSIEASICKYEISASITQRIIETFL